MDKPSPILLILLATLISALIVRSGTNSHDRAVWHAEIIPVTSAFFLLVATYRIFHFSNLAYLFMNSWLIMHPIGAYYTFADMSFEPINRSVESILGENRNHYDRIAHYTIGFYTYPMAEWLLCRKLCNLPLALFFSLFFIMNVAAAYEIIEWQYAVIDGGEAGPEFLGSQGDVRDVQKDMLADTLGVLTPLFTFVLIQPNKRSGFSQIHLFKAKGRLKPDSQMAFFYFSIAIIAKVNKYDS